MLTLELTNLRFFAFHGLYAEENKIGAEFIVDIALDLPIKFPVTGLNETVDYTDVYTIVKKIMMQPQPLLETVAGKIAEAIFANFSQPESVTIIIRKMNPPIIAFEGNVGIKYTVTKNKNL